jgi:hypothetical protein
MTDLMEILEAVDRLSEEDKAQLKAYLNRASMPVKTSPIIFNLHPGAMVMADDFDDELPDEFWFGEA